VAVPDYVVRFEQWSAATASASLLTARIRRLFTDFPATTPGSARHGIVEQSNS
jgi:hypothetical protein